MVRLPSADRYAAGAEKEREVLPLLSPYLPLSIPRVVAAFTAEPTFPRPWSIMAWIDGETGHGVDRADQVALASDLAVLLRAVQAVDPAGGPPPGAHSLGRGGAPSLYDDEMRWALARLGPRRASTAAIWERALASPYTGPPVWLHGDLHPGNLLVRNGRLIAVIDWGVGGGRRPGGRFFDRVAVVRRRRAPGVPHRAFHKRGRVGTRRGLGGVEGGDHACRTDRHRFR